MKSKKPGMLLCRALVSLIVMLMIGFLGLGVRAFATADTTQFIFSAAFVISVTVLVLYFMLRRPTRELTAYSLFREPPFVKRFLLPRLSTIGGNPLTLDHLSERQSGADLVVIKAAGGSLAVSL
jgi:ABC-type Na+ efflux pump permease subunit